MTNEVVCLYSKIIKNIIYVELLLGGNALNRGIIANTPALICADVDVNIIVMTSSFFCLNAPHLYLLLSPLWR